MAEKYRHADGLEALDLQDETVILHMESANFFTLNNTAAAIWAALSEPATSEQIAAAVVDRFEGVNADTAQQDVDRIVAQLLEHKLVTDEISS